MINKNNNLISLINLLIKVPLKTYPIYNYYNFSLAKLIHNYSKVLTSKTSKPKISRIPIEINYL